MIGSQLCKRLVVAGANVTGLDNNERGRNLTPGVHHYNFDLVEDTIEGSGSWAFEDAEVVFHLAAKVTGIEYNRFHHLDMMQRNLAINWAVTEKVRDYNPHLYVFVSTACVYPHDAPVPTPESCAEVCDCERSNHGYGIAKWVGEQQARYLALELGIPTLIVRFFNAFGPNDYYDEETSHVAPALIRRVLEGEDPLVVWGTGNQTRALVDCRDIAKALMLLGEKAEFTSDHPLLVANIGHKREVSIRELAETICRLAGKSPRIVFDDSRPDGYPRRAADTWLLENLLGWVPDTPLEVTLADMIAEYRAKTAR